RIEYNADNLLILHKDAGYFALVGTPDFSRQLFCFRCSVAVVPLNDDGHDQSTLVAQLDLVEVFTFKFAERFLVVNPATELPVKPGVGRDYVKRSWACIEGRLSGFGRSEISLGALFVAAFQVCLFRIQAAP